MAHSKFSRVSSSKQHAVTELWLVRHGQTNWNLSGRWQGQSPFAPGLNDAGWAQVLEIREQLKERHLSAAYSSDLLRARQTAELIAEPLDLSLTLEPRLREIDLGLWEGLPAEEIEAKYSQELAGRMQDPFHTRAPDGESPYDVAGRVLAATGAIVDHHHGESVLIVSHGIALAVMICHAEGIPMEEIHQHIPDNAQPYRLQWC